MAKESVSSRVEGAPERQASSARGERPAQRSYILHSGGVRAQPEGKADGSTRFAAQRARIESIHSSPRMAVQRHQCDVISQQPAQLFKADAADAAEVTDADIANANLVTLQAWLARPPADPSWAWDDERADLIPDVAMRAKITLRVNALVAQAQAAARLANLGVTAAELVLFETTTNSDALITAAAAHMKAQGWNIAALLGAIAGFGAAEREIAIAVCAKGEVDLDQSVILLAQTWGVLNGRDTIVVADLVSLLAHRAVVFAGGVYRSVPLTGTEDKAFTFYANATQRRRIDPEWHVHTTHQGVPQRPGFKTHAAKMLVGPGTRRDATAPEIGLMTGAGLV